MRILDRYILKELLGTLLLRHLRICEHSRRYRAVIPHCPVHQPVRRFPLDLRQAACL